MVETMRDKEVEQWLELKKWCDAFNEKGIPTEDSAGKTYFETVMWRVADIQAQFREYRNDILKSQTDFSQHVYGLHFQDRPTRQYAHASNEYPYGITTRSRRTWKTYEIKQDILWVNPEVEIRMEQAFIHAQALGQLTHGTVDVCCFQNTNCGSVKRITHIHIFRLVLKEQT